MPHALSTALGQGAWLGKQSLDWASGPIHPTQPGTLVPQTPYKAAWCHPGHSAWSSVLFCFTLSLCNLIDFRGSKTGMSYLISRHLFIQLLSFCSSGSCGCPKLAKAQAGFISSLLACTQTSIVLYSLSGLKHRPPASRSMENFPDCLRLFPFLSLRIVSQRHYSFLTGVSNFRTSPLYVTLLIAIGFLSLYRIRQTASLFKSQFFQLTIG